MGNIGVMLYI